MLNFSKDDLVVSHLRYGRLWFWMGIGLIVAIVMMSLIRIPPPVTEILLNDKLLHCAVYACLMGWFGQLFHDKFTLLVFAVLFIVMGATMEVLQSLTPHRKFELLDMIANASGVLLAWALSFTWVGSILEWFERTVLKPPSLITD